MHYHNAILPLLLDMEMAPGNDATERWSLLFITDELVLIIQEMMNDRVMSDTTFDLKYPGLSKEVT